MKNLSQFGIIININYRNVASEIWPIFPEFLIFCRVISPLGEWSDNKNMRNKENIGDIVRGKCSIIGLSLKDEKYLLSANSSFIKWRKKT